MEWWNFGNGGCLPFFYNLLLYLLSSLACCFYNFIQNHPESVNETYVSVKEANTEVIVAKTQITVC